MTGSGGAVRAASRLRARPAAAVPSTAQAGFTLVEILICVVLVGTILLALAGGMLTLARTSNATTQRQQIQLSLGSYTESLKASPYLPCGAPTVPAPASYQALYDSWPERWVPTRTGMTARITRVEFWDEAAGSEGAYVASCPGMDQGTQRLTVEIEWRGRSGTAEVVKSYRPAAGP